MRGALVVAWMACACGSDVVVSFVGPSRTFSASADAAVEADAMGPPDAAAPRPRLCWSTPRPVGDLDGDRRFERGATPLFDGAALWLYFSSERWDTGGYSRLARVRMLDADTPDPTTLELIFPPATTTVTRGWIASGPTFSRDGLEMLFASSHPDARWEDAEIWRATRTSTSASWDAPRVVEPIGSSSTHDDGRSLPILMADSRALVYGDGDGYTWATRRSPSDAFVVSERRLQIPGNGELEAASASCDGAHLIYRVTQQPVRIAAITGSALLSLGEPTLFDLRPLPNGYFSIVELPDCSAVYVGTYGFGGFVAEREPCSAADDAGP